MILATHINEARLRTSVLDSIEDILKLDDWFGTARTQQSITLQFERYGGLDALEELQKHPNIDIYNRCSEILLKYFEPADKMDMGGPGGDEEYRTPAAVNNANM